MVWPCFAGQLCGRDAHYPSQDQSYPAVSSPVFIHMQPEGHWLGAWVSRPRQTSRARCPKTDDKKDTHCYGLAVLRRPVVRARRPLSQPRPIAFLLCHQRFLYVCSPKGHWLGAWVSRPRQTSRARCPKTDDKKDTHCYGLAVLRRPVVRARRPLSQPRPIVANFTRPIKTNFTRPP